jgi:hypothetical protein
LFYQNNTDIANDFPLQDRPTCSVPLLAWCTCYPSNNANN